MDPTLSAALVSGAIALVAALGNIVHNRSENKRLAKIAATDDVAKRIQVAGQEVDRMMRELRQQRDELKAELDRVKIEADEAELSAKHAQNQADEAERRLKFANEECERITRAHNQLEDSYFQLRIVYDALANVVRLRSTDATLPPLSEELAMRISQLRSAESKKEG